MNHPDAEDLTRTLRGPRTLLEMCLDLRMAHNGSADPISEEETAAALAYLRHRLATWKPSILPQGARFDMAVNELVKATIAEVEWRQIETARLLGSPAPQGPVTEADPLAGLPEAERARIVAGAANAMPENRARFVANSVAAYHARQKGVGVAIGREGQWFPQSTGTHTFGGRLRADCAPAAQAESVPAGGHKHEGLDIVCSLDKGHDPPHCPIHTGARCPCATAEERTVGDGSLVYLTITVPESWKEPLP